jgi:hypothetical protein
LSSSTETSVDVVTDQRASYSSAIPEDHHLAIISRPFTKGVGIIYSLMLLGLPSAYSIRAARYASAPAERIVFVNLLIGEWKIVVFGATFLLSSVITPCQILFLPDCHARSILAILDLPHAVDHIVVKMLGFMSLACGVMTVAFSSLLIAAFNAHHAHLESLCDDISADVERQQVASVPLSAVNDSIC